VQKGGKDASVHILDVFKESPSLLINVKPSLLNMLLDTAGSDYALALAKLIKADMLSNTDSRSVINPEIALLLIEANTQAAQHIMLLITSKNITAIDSRIKEALKNKLGNTWQDHLKKIYDQARKDAPLKTEEPKKKTLLEKIGFSNGKK
jgi:hypothetical protein